ncbi:unnamed protein product, partial [Rotaria magnacalcarata]
MNLNQNDVSVNGSIIENETIVNCCKLEKFRKKSIRSSKIGIFAISVSE